MFSGQLSARRWSGSLSGPCGRRGASTVRGRQMPVANVNLVTLNDVYTHLHLNGVPYMFGGKAEHWAHGVPLQGIDASVIKGIDCSGFTRYVLAKATAGALIIPDGSVEQHDWARSHLPKVDYGDAMTGRQLLIAFIEPQHGHPGHVWLVRQGFTRESHGSVGVDARPWNTPILINNVAGAYLLPATM